MTKRANTFPLNPLPRSPDGDINGFSAGTLSLVTEPPEAPTMRGSESGWFATALKLVRTARA
jgi:hypothetical protein